MGSDSDDDPLQISSDDEDEEVCLLSLLAHAV